MANTNNVITATLIAMLADEKLELSKRDKLALTLATAIAPLVDGLLHAATEAVKELPAEQREVRELKRAQRALMMREIERDLARIDEKERAEREERARKEREAEREEIKRELRLELAAEGRRKR